MPSQDSWIYRSGDVFAPKHIRAFLETFLYGSYDQTVYITYWSIMHLLSGVFTAIVLQRLKITKHPYWMGFLIHTLWELWQVWINMSKPFKIVGHNNIVDIILDTVLFMIGMGLVLGQKN